MKDLKNTFRTIEKSLKASHWFNDGWEIYNRGVYLQLYKSNWHNDNQGGIHFETHIESREVKQKEFPISLHVEDNTPFQNAFIEKLLSLEAERIKSWKGYKIGKGYSLCKRTLPLNPKNLEQRILEELNRLRQLEASIDETLQIIGA
ncbi:MAG: hypothetical protein U9O64_10765 [Campylobacterota bacterium]|nr:hypothetical protein [Campylobacterota bacterium]